MNQVPHITIEHASIFLAEDVNEIHALVDLFNRRIDAYNKANEQPEPVLQEDPLSVNFIQTIPDKCDRIVWRGSYYHLPLKNASAAEPTCQVRNEDTGELETMTREAAKLLQAELGATVEWIVHGTKYEWEGEVFAFDGKGSIYTYKLKAKPLKQVSWSSVPVGVAVIAVDSDGENACLGQIRYASSSHCVVERASNMAGCNSVSYDVNLLKLAPASEQTNWIARQDKYNGEVEGLVYDWRDNGSYRITGLAEGWVLK